MAEDQKRRALRVGRVRVRRVRSAPQITTGTRDPPIKLFNKEK